MMLKLLKSNSLGLAILARAAVSFAFPAAFTSWGGVKLTDVLKSALAALAEKNPCIRFKLHCATLYSFWISPSARGESRGYVAAGGPAYPGLRDL